MGFTAGLIILLNCWASVWHHRSVDWDKEMTYVDKAMGVLELAEERFAWPYLAFVEEMLNTILQVEFRRTLLVRSTYLYV